MLEAWEETGSEGAGAVASARDSCLFTCRVDVYKCLLSAFNRFRGTAFTVLGRHGSEGERKEEGKRYDSDAPLAATRPDSPSPLSLSFPSALLSLLSTKVCLIHKGLIAITAAAPSSACLVPALGSPSLFSGERT